MMKGDILTGYIVNELRTSRHFLYLLVDGSDSAGIGMVVL